MSDTTAFAALYAIGGLICGVLATWAIISVAVAFGIGKGRQ